MDYLLGRSKNSTPEAAASAAGASEPVPGHNMGTTHATSSSSPVNPEVYGNMDTGPVALNTLGGEPGAFAASAAPKKDLRVPPAPGVPVAVERTATSLTIAWAENASDPAPDYDFITAQVNPQVEYDLRYARGGYAYDLWNSVGAFTSLRWIRVEGLVPDQAYIFQVRARYRDVHAASSPSLIESANVVLSRSAKAEKSPYKWGSASATSARYSTLLLDEQERFDNLSRLRLYIVDGALKFPPFPEDPEVPDTVTAKAARTMEGLVTAVGSTGLGGAYFALVKNAWKIHKTGIASLIFHADLQQTVYVLLNFLNTVAANIGLTSRDVVVGSYFALWEAKRERLLYPQAELEEHDSDQPGVLMSEVPPTLLNELMFYFPLAGMSYRKTPAEIQWVLDKFTAADPRDTDRDDASWQGVDEEDMAEIRRVLQEEAQGSAQRGFRLIMARTRSEKFKPAFFLAAHEELKTAVFVIRGTHEIEDVVTDGLCDVEAAAFSFGEDEREFHVHAGMLKAAQWLVQGDDRRRHFEEDTRPAEEQGPRDGAGVGAAVAKLWTAGYRRVIFAGHSLGGGVAVLAGLLIADRFRDLRIRVYGYGTPAVVDEVLAEACKGQHGHPEKQIKGLGDRVTVKNFIRHDDLVSRLSLLTARDFAVQLKETRSKWGPLLDEDISSFTSRIKTAWAPIQRAHALRRSTARLSKHGSSTKANGADTSNPDSMEVEESRQPAAMDIVVANPTPEVTTVMMDGVGISATKDTKIGQVADAVVSDALKSPQSSSAKTSDTKPEPKSREVLERLERSFSNRLVVPGLIVHTFMYNGTHRASLVDYNFQPLRRISAFQNCIEDHRFEQIMIAARSVLFAKDAREAGRHPPHWESLLDHGTDSEEWQVRCRVCTYPVSWHFTSNSEAFEIRATHHCYSCGKIVCSKCSEGRVALPHVGIIEPVRVCDLCRHHLFEPKTGQKNMFDFEEF